jgi:glycosyltransferase involved in cell wall biosynthesis
MSQQYPRPLVSVVVPAFNEAAILQANLQRTCDYLDTLGEPCSWELIVVDDGSTDGTGELALAAAATRREIRVHRHPINLGLGQALRTGFRLCRGDYIVVLDLDLTYAPEHVGRLLERIRASGSEIVLASPYMAGGRASSVPWVRRQLSRWANRFLALTARGVISGGNVSTLTGMVRAYDARFIRSLNLKSTGVEINTEILYKGMILNARIEEIPAHLDWGARRRGYSVWSSRRRIRRGIVLSLLAGFIIRPFAFFIIPAALLAMVSLYMVAWIGLHVVRHWREVAPAGGSFDAMFSESVARAFQQAPHAFIVAGITLLLSAQLFSLGVLALQAKQYFEELFHFGTRLYSHSRELERLLAGRTGQPPVE